MYTKGVPVPNGVPPHEDKYQCHEAPVPKVPPVILRVLEAPGHNARGEDIADVAAVEVVFIRTYKEEALPLPQLFDGVTITLPEVVPTV